MSGNEKRVLLLGAGMVSDPLAQYFGNQSKLSLTVATDSQRDGHRLTTYGTNINSVVVDVQKEPDVIDDLISKHDLVISLLPYTHHTGIAKMCIKNQTNMVTSSYITPELEALDEE